MANPKAPSNVITEHPQNGDERVKKGNAKLNEQATKREKKLKKAHQAAGAKIRTGRGE